MITGKVLGKSYVINGISADASAYIPDMSAATYYEVIRLIDRKLLFLQDHLQRFEASLSGSGTIYPGHDRIVESLRMLIAGNPFNNGNIRICLQRSFGDEVILLCYFVPYFYPDPGMYKKGVRLATFPHQRPNPGIKKWDHHFRSSVSRFILEQGVYEAALLNPAKQITEGSRSNLFFIDRDERLLTVPEKEILPGITRKYILQIAGKAGIPIIEKTIELESLDGLVSAFISGTSPKVLPVNQVDHFSFDVTHPVLQKLMTQFEKLLEENLTLL